MAEWVVALDLDPVWRSLAALFWAWVPPAALQGGIALLLAAAADRLLPSEVVPDVREAIWGLALVKLLLPPTLASPLAAAPLLFPKLAAGLSAPLGEDPATWAAPLAALWLAGVVAAMARRQWVTRRLARRLASARLPATVADRAALAVAAALLGCRRLPALHRIATPSPFVWGVSRPEIYLPLAAGEAELQHLLLHELAHVTRRDGLRRALAATLHDLFWFHPLLPWARRRLAAAAEAACDRRTARALGEGAARYRATLLDYYGRAAAPPLAAGFVAPPTALRLRLAAIAAAAEPSSALRRWSTGLLVVALAALALPMAARAEQAALGVSERVARPPGCLQLRYLVLQRLAASRAQAASDDQPER